MSCWRITPRLPEEKKAGQVTVLFILLRMDNNRKKITLLYQWNRHNCARLFQKKTYIIKCYSDFQEIWPIAQEAILH